ncbi:MAG: hypothetical protein EPO16_06980, partial [Dehalococcoidia bacterium]
AGLGIVLWGGGPPSAVAAAVAAKGCTLQSLWITSGGQITGYVAGAPGFVNDAFVARLAGGVIAPQTPIVLVCTAGTTPAVSATFPAGIYYRLPGLSSPQATLTRVEGALPSTILLAPGGFDLRGQTLAYTDGSQVTLATADGASRSVQVDGLYSLARPSLSPDGNRVAVQATRTPPQAASAPLNLGIFVIDVTTKTFVELPGTPDNEESPEWFPTGDRVLYSSFSPTAGVNLHVYDVAARREVLTLPDGGALHMAVSADGQRILDMWRFRIYDANTGAVQADLLAGVRASLTALGLTMDAVHNGRDGRGSFPLDGAFSPDGRTIVFDGAVVQGTRSGLMLFTVGVDGTGFRAISGLIETDAAFTNNFNYSPLNPLWR